MSKKVEDIAKEIFEKIESDLRDRRGIRHEWDMVDDDIQEEIRETNQKHIVDVLAKYIKD